MPLKLKPIVKWAGGKRQLLPDIRRRLPQINWNEAAYYEPFVGGAALLFHIQPARAIINDVNPELINLYQMIKQHPEELIERLRAHRNEELYYYDIRQQDRDHERYSRMSAVERAARLIYLNRTCFNGLYRVNKRGQFNVPFGKNKRPDFVQEKKIRNMSRYFNDADITITAGDFAASVEHAKCGDFIYFDPPYDALTKTAAFTSYTNAGFNRHEQSRLADLFQNLHERGVYLMLSNHATDFIRELYEKFYIHEVQARRLINSKGTARGKINEVLVLNYTAAHESDNSLMLC
ncbi:DNA adenine methylase [Paenibacillus sp. 481]|uniref:DNA adenine methylase n=1 Tax=Paenibacillus sp. 481 TaxID=2835869 RepID=UPI001E54FAAC|nr:DNA adenine methylase [Paenibacillus sp. 481]UHA74875.1 DNA adenine methylase [Paenibacillus sp. 481]